MKAEAVTLEHVQLAIGGAVLKCSRSQLHNRGVLATLGWPTLAWRRRRGTKLLLLWKVIHEEAFLPLRKFCRALKWAMLHTTFGLLTLCVFPFVTCLVACGLFFPLRLLTGTAFLSCFCLLLPAPPPYRG